MQFITNLIAGLVSSISNFGSELALSLEFADLSFWQVLLDILIVAALVYLLLKMLKGSRSISILLGLLIMGLAYLISHSLNLLTVGWLLDNFFTVFLVSIPIIFQQELRMTLERIGNASIFSTSLERKQKLNTLLDRLTETIEYLAARKIGALIVIHHHIPLKEYVDTGIKLDSDISSELLISIFQGKSPLHDGAVIIKDDKILAAKCILPTSFDDNFKEFGTRHRAAIGLTDNTDASVIVVSEERGVISFAHRGKLETILDVKRLKQLLTHDFVSSTSK